MTRHPTRARHLRLPRADFSPGRLLRDRKGSGVLEFLILSSVLLAVFIGLSAFGVTSVERMRDMRAVRSGLDVAVLLAAEQAVPTEADIAELVRAVRDAGAIGDDETYAVRVAVFARHGTDPAGLLWQGGSGDLAFDPAVRLEGDLLMVGTQSYPITAKDAVVSVELHRRKQGLFLGGEADEREIAFVYRKLSDMAPVTP